jgi:transposase
MALGKQPSEEQGSLWVETQSLVQSPGHPFYERLNGLLAEHGFDAMAAEACAPHYADGVGRPGIPPGVYFRMLLVGFFEGIDSERGIAWRAADSMALRAFLGYGLTERTPEHSTLSRTRHRIPLETHQHVFDWVLTVLAKEGLLKGRTLSVDATTLEANAALRSIVRRDTGESYEAFLLQLAKASGIETPRREDLARIDKNRPGKGSNGDWQNPHDPDARITRMKDGRTHMAHKAEHAVDLITGALVAVTLQPADRGDTHTLGPTLERARASLATVARHDAARRRLEPTRETVLDKGYHSDAVLEALDDQHHLTSYVSEPRRPRRNWRGKPQARARLYANRRRVTGPRGLALLRLRGERLERSFAHLYETGAMRRTHLRGHLNILKRLLIHACGFNLGLLMRKTTGAGTPRGLHALRQACLRFIAALWFPAQPRTMPTHKTHDRAKRTRPQGTRQLRGCLKTALATGC